MITTTNNKREEIIKKFNDVIAEYGDALEYTIPDNCPGDGECGVVYTDKIARALDGGNFYESFDYDDIETDVLEEIYDNLDIWEETDEDETETAPVSVETPKVYIINRVSATEKYGREEWTMEFATLNQETALKEFGDVVDEVCQKFHQSYDEDETTDSMEENITEGCVRAFRRYAVWDESGDDYEEVSLLELPVK